MTRKKKKPLKIGFSEDQYGFTWGAAQVIRACSDANGAVILWIKTPKDDLHVRVTRTGLIRTGRGKSYEIDRLIDRLWKKEGEGK